MFEIFHTISSADLLMSGFILAVIKYLVNSISNIEEKVEDIYQILNQMNENKDGGKK